MSRRVDLPSTEKVRTAIRDLTAQSPDSVLTVSDLSRHLGLTRGTFWRHFPNIAQAVADDRRSNLRPAAKLPPVTRERKDETERRLRAQIEVLRSQVARAAAQVQRLTLENHALRQHLEAESTIIHIPRNR